MFILERCLFWILSPTNLFFHVSKSFQRHQYGCQGGDWVGHHYSYGVAKVNNYSKAMRDNKQTIEHKTAKWNRIAVVLTEKKHPFIRMEEQKSSDEKDAFLKLLSNCTRLACHNLSEMIFLDPLFRSQNFINWKNFLNLTFFIIKWICGACVLTIAFCHSVRPSINYSVSRLAVCTGPTSSAMLFKFSLLLHP